VAAVEDQLAGILVVGAGSAGAALAGRLVEAGRDVTLVERGPDYGPFGSPDWPADLCDATTIATSHDAGYDSGTQYGERVVTFERALVIGGCSTHNGCIAAVGHPSDYDGWGVPGWSAADLRPLFERALRQMRVRTYQNDEAGPFHRAALEAAAQAGHPGPLALDDLDAGVGFGLESVNIDGRVRFNAAFAYLDPVRGRPNLRILDRTRVDKLEPDPAGGVVVHAVRTGEALKLHAEQAVVCAGTYDTPALLMRSGIGSPTTLAKLGVVARHPLPGVGQNLHDHPLIELSFARSDHLQRELGDASAKGFVPEEQTLGKFASSCCEGPYDLHILPLGASSQVRLLDAGCAIAISPVCPRSRGQLTLASSDPGAVPVAEHNYLEDPDGHDLAVMRDGIEIALDLAAQPAFRAMLGPQLTSIKSDDAIRANVMHYYHPVGTCRMGPSSDATAVCDEHGRLHGLPQITIADCSLMPQVPRANTNIPAVVIGERIAEILAA
jgi:choline dehydrogenase